MDTNIGTIVGLVKTCHSSHYGNFVDVDHYGLTHLGVKFGVYAKDRQKVDQSLQALSKGPCCRQAGICCIFFMLMIESKK